MMDGAPMQPPGGFGQAEKLDLRLAVVKAGLAGTAIGRAVELVCDGLSVGEIADRLGCSDHVVHARLSRARARGLAVPMMREIGRARGNGSMPGGMRPAIGRLPAEKLRAMARARGMSGAALAAKLLVALADEPVLVANLLDEADR